MVWKYAFDTGKETAILEEATPPGRLQVMAVLTRTGACARRQEEEEELLAAALSSGRATIFGSHFLISEGEASSFLLELAGRSAQSWEVGKFISTSRVVKSERLMLTPVP